MDEEDKDGKGRMKGSMMVWLETEEYRNPTGGKKKRRYANGISFFHFEIL